MEELRFSDYCANCRKSLAALEKILFVEKEVGRCFCCEECIRDYFQPTVDFMDEEYRRQRTETDFSDVEGLQFSHYRSLALEDPDEVWAEVTETGERHFTFIAHFRSGEERVSYVVICLTIEGAPSFVFLGFASRDEDLVDEYRRGTDLRIGDDLGEGLSGELAALPERQLRAVASVASDDAEYSAEAPEELPEELHGASPDEPRDASGGESQTSRASTFERLYAELRQAGDIPREFFDKFNNFVEPTLEDPDEIWRFVDDSGNEWCTFIAKHRVSASLDDAGEIDEFVMICVCEPALLAPGRTAKTLEVIFTFPTLDPGLVQHFRKGINSLNRAFGVGWARGRAA